MSTALSEALARLPELLAGHMLLALAALGVGMAISFPAGVWAARNAAARSVATSTASIVQTIPSIALLALMVPVFGGQIGFAPAFAALMLYSMLPVLRNTVVGLAGVDPTVREAALAVGMTPAQRLIKVELPLALPVIVAGVRTAAVLVVGTATLATPVGATSLGELIFSGLQTRNWTSVLVGCFAAATLAIVLDQALRLLERFAATRERRAGLAAGAAFAVLAAVIVAPFGLTALTNRDQTQTFAVAEESDIPLAGRTVRVGAKTFTEQFILARLIKARIEAAGGEVELIESLGSTIGFDALTSDDIDVFVDYTGTIWANVLRRDDPAPRAVVSAETSARLWLDLGVLTLGELGFENAWAFAMTRQGADALGARAITDLTDRAAELTFASDYEFFGRPEWPRTRDAYVLQDMATRSMDSTFLYDAVRNGQVDVITAYTSDGRIDAFDLVILDDPRQALPPYDAVMLLGPSAARDPALARALRPLVNQITPDLMRRANAMVDLERASVSEAAAWLEEQLFE